MGPISFLVVKLSHYQSIRYHCHPSNPTYQIVKLMCNIETEFIFLSSFRYWDLVERHKVTQFYTAPTAVRALMRYDTTPIANYDLSSLRVLGSVGK